MLDQIPLRLAMSSWIENEYDDFNEGMYRFYKIMILRRRSYFWINSRLMRYIMIILVHVVFRLSVRPFVRLSVHQ